MTTETKQLWKQLADHVYPYDDISSSLRNRFYLERLRRFVQEHERPVFINLGAGFSSYPFLLQNDCSCIEVDLKRIVDYKRERIKHWQHEGFLPQRSIEFLAADLTSDADQKRLEEALVLSCQGQTSFILMEGLTYYLSAAILQKLLGMFRRYQTPGSLLAFEYWTPDADTYPVFVRLKDYLARYFGQTRPDYNLFDEALVSSIPDYKVQESANIAEQEIAYSSTRLLQDRNNRLPIQFAVLSRA